MIDWSSLDAELDRQRDSTKKPRSHDELVEDALNLLEMKFDVNKMDPKHRKQEPGRWKTYNRWKTWGNLTLI